MRRLLRHIPIIMTGLWFLFAFTVTAQVPVVIDHTCTDITQIPQSAIEQAKSTLHIAYGHTSHGSQLTTGMNGLVGFMNGKGYPNDLYDWNNGGSNGALDLHDYAMGGDVGYYPQWVNNTRTYLDNPVNADVNVIIWSWCGQASSRTEETMRSTYLGPMNDLEGEYPNVTFVYMTGHLDGSGAAGNLNLRNQQIRDYCEANDKVLYDFADIESYDPDGLVNYMLLMCNDGCYYDSDNNGSRDANWATEWQNSHTEDVDWYSCGSAHSVALNANRKAYAAWWLWARLAGWAGPIQDSTPPSVPQNFSATAVSASQIDLSWNASSDAESGVPRYNIYQDNTYIGNTSGTTYSVTGLIADTEYGFQVAAMNGAGLLSDRTSEQTATTDPAPVDNESPTIPQNLSATAVSSSQIDLSWNASTDNVNVTGYRVYRNSSQISTTTNTSYNDDNLQASTQYSYTVRAYDLVGNLSNHSQAASATTLDPSSQQNTVQLIQPDTEVLDAFLESASPTTNYGSTNYLGTIDRFIIQFTLPAVLNNKQIVEANLYFYVWNQTNYQAGQYLDIYRVTSSWQEGSTTWNNRYTGQTWNAAGGDYDNSGTVDRILHQAGSSNWDHVYYPPANITSLVQGWVDGTVPNYGVLVLNEGSTGIGFKASEYSSGRPYLEITYTDKPANDRPNAPQMMQVETHNTNQVCASWQAVQNAGGYNVYRSTEAWFTPDAGNCIGANVTDSDGSAAGVQWIDSENVLGDPSTNYFYAVSSLNGALESTDYTRFGEFDYQLVTTGSTNYNEIALPLSMTGVEDAADLMQSIPECNSVARWNVQDQGYESYIPGIQATNFDVETGQCYYVNVTSSTVFSMTGSLLAPQYNLITTNRTNFNEVMLTLDKTGITNASGLMADIPNCNSVAFWDAGIQGYQQYVSAIPFTNFDVRPGYPYYVNVTTNTTWPGTLPSKIVAETIVHSNQKKTSKAPHLAWGRIQVEDPLSLECVHFESFITSREDEVLTQDSPGCGIEDGFWLVQCSSFPSGWNASETLKTVFYTGDVSPQAERHVILTYNSSDSADVVILSQTGISQDVGLIPESSKLYQNHPNPFNPQTSITFDVEASGHVLLQVYNLNGQLVQTLVDGECSAGQHSVLWQPKDLPSGVYVYYFQSGLFSSRKKMLFLK